VFYARLTSQAEALKEQLAELCLSDEVSFGDGASEREVAEDTFSKAPVLSFEPWEIDDILSRAYRRKHDMSVKSCPYCGIRFSLDGVSIDYCSPKFERVNFYSKKSSHDEGDKHYTIASHKCPECRKQIMWLHEVVFKEGDEGTLDTEIVSTMLLFPKHPIKQIPDEVPEKLALDFREAYETLSISPKASAALSRRCLQNLIREEGIVEKTLFAEIQQLLKKNKLPKYLADDLDSIRNVGTSLLTPSKTQILDKLWKWSQAKPNGH